MDTEDMNTKDKIFQTTLELIAQVDSIEQLTVKKIASEANVNVALINYYFSSKENLLRQVVGVKMGKLIERLFTEEDNPLPPQLQLKTLLVKTANLGFQFYEINKVAVAGDMENGCRNSCSLVMPLLKEIYKEYGGEELKLLALQLMVPFNNIMLYTQAYNAYLETDFFDSKKRVYTIERMVDSFLQGGDRNEDVK